MDLTQFYPEIHLLLLLVAVLGIVLILWIMKKLGVSIDELRQAIQIIKGNQLEIKAALDRTSQVPQQITSPKPDKPAFWEQNTPKNLER